MAEKKYLIVNADDFGLSSGVNMGIIEAHQHGIVTSASLMVRWPDAADAAALGREHPGLSMGLHIDLGEWIYTNGKWEPLYEVVSLKDGSAVAEEVSRQLDDFHRLVGNNPSHIDSHQHVHLRKPIKRLLLDISQKLSIPLRHCNPRIKYCGNFYGQTEKGESFPDFVSVDNLIKILKSVPSGITELGCHPGKDDNLNTMYSSERSRELKTLIDRRIKKCIDELGIELCSFYNIFSYPGFKRGM
jgi:predicted glycoside hydrolase/deacetylase ChbG (UPF0249 family)